MMCSIVMAAYNKGPLLDKVLASIRAQTPPFDYELIVVNDGSDDETEEVCDRYGVEYTYLDRPGYTSPTVSRNVGYRMARGEIVIAQSADTYHSGYDVIERLCDIAPRTFNIATVKALGRGGLCESYYTGLMNQRPFFFLGSLYRKDLYAIGGDDEEFDVLGCDDDWFADRLLNGRGLKPVYRDDIVGCHQWHDRPIEHWDNQFHRAQEILRNKRNEAKSTGEWFAAGGPWSLTA